MSSNNSAEFCYCILFVLVAKCYLPSVCLQYGEIEKMNVCDNLGDHLVGNVYVKVRESGWNSM